MKLEIPTSILDVLGNALVIAAKHAPDNGVYVQTWAWLHAESQRAAQAEAQAARETQEQEIRRKLEQEIRDKLSQAAQKE